jgi:hypothetical protein
MAAPFSDRLTGALRAMVNQWMRRVDYLALYPGNIVQTNSDGTVDFQPDSDQVPGVGSVPFKTGLPGATVKCHNTRGLLGFEGGDPGAPYVLAEFGLGVADLIDVLCTSIKLRGAIELHAANYLGHAVLRDGDIITLTGGTVTPGAPGVGQVVTATVAITSPKSGVKA